jgi:hypothetical protein
MKPADKYAVQEITLYIENDAGLYRQIYQSIVRNYARKVINKTYRHEPAIRGVVNLIDAGIRKYRKEMGIESAREYGLGMGVSAATKTAAAKIILRGMTEEIKDEVKRLRMGRK